MPPWAPRTKQKCARLSERPTFHASCTVQRLSSVRQASQLSPSVRRPRDTMAVVTVSSRVITEGPSESCGWAAVASSAAR